MKAYQVAMSGTYKISALFAFPFDGKEKSMLGNDSRAWAVNSPADFQGFSLCFILSNMSTAYMCFADKKRKMNLLTLSQTRQESTV